MNINNILVLFIVFYSFITHVGAATGSDASGNAGTRPNVLLIVVDDIAFNDLGLFGSEIRTPNYLNEIGEYDNTVIFFMSDNGPEGHAMQHSFVEVAEWAQACCDNSYENLGNGSCTTWRTTRRR